ncbi:hypothetical protein Zmor_020447 [Zophobas morio]|uniref:TRASH domain-containing protein n=1 Tax=Zophobas morio TaxID=2755281 RepID=A0AA38I7L4_9CUCU|nr:hypothetical protein Zmor_020447 [Zophobas morio]
MASTSTANSSVTNMITKCEPYELQTCFQCQTKRKVQYRINNNNNIFYICYSNCLDNFKRENPNFYENWFHTISVRNFTRVVTTSSRVCSVCKSKLDNNYGVTWQAMDFCNELCLLERQIELCSLCVHCAVEIPPDSLGKYCISFGTDIRQFCSSMCLNSEQNHHEMCCFCLQNKKMQILDNNKKFCSPKCKHNFDLLDRNPTEIRCCKKCNTLCSPCIKYASLYFDPESFFCSNQCFQKFVSENCISAKACSYCSTYINLNLESGYPLFDTFTLYYFCSNTCRKLYINATKVPVDCGKCSMKKSNFDMIRKHCDKRVTSFCSLKCLGLHQFIEQWLIARCDQCLGSKAQMFTFPMSDSSMCNFCSFRCLYKFRLNTTGNQNVSLYLKDYMKIVPAASTTQNKLFVNVTPPCTATRERGRPKKVPCPPAPQQTGNINVTKSNVNNPEIECIFIQNDINDFQSVSFDFQLDESAFIELPPENNASSLFECTFGINTFAYWLTCQHSAQTNALQMTLEELNSSLAGFVQSIKKPDGEKFAPDTIYYLCLGIQKYLIENGRNTNIFCDRGFEDFRKSLDKVALTFQIPHTFLATTIEENHLWDTKQLGDCSPQVLINTLIYIFTKTCYLTSVQNHLGLSLKQVNQELTSGYKCGRPPNSIIVACCFRYGPSCLYKNTYILQSNQDNPSRCPIRLCQLYVDKCPSVVKLYEQVFYLQPMENCRPENGLWFKVATLPQETIQRTLNLIRMVKEINDVFVNV